MRQRGSILIACLAALVPAVPIVIGLLLSSSAPSKAAAGTSAGFTPLHSSISSAATDHPASTTTTASTASSSTGSNASPPAKPDPNAVPAGPGALIATIVHGTTMRSAPGGRALAKMATQTGFGSPQVVWVASRSGSWLGVVSVLAGNGKLGWIPRSATRLSRVNWKIEVSLSARRVTVLDAGHVVQRYTVAVGKPSAPTPTGRFAVTDRLLTGQPSGPYGCCILALSAVSPHEIQGWGGGDRIAIHSTPETDSIGQPVSHGCMRLTLPEGQWLVDHVPLGTPTLIRT